MKLAIMQPYFLPYIGYFNLMRAADEFVIYDNIQFSKKGWINRNRILVNGGDAFITIPLKKGSDFLDVKDRWIADTWPTDRRKLLNRVAGAYMKAPYFEDAYPVFEKCVLHEERNLFGFILNSLQEIKRYLEIETPFVVSSTLDVDHSLRSQDRVMAICKSRRADEYINPIGGVGLYSRESFEQAGITLRFLQAGSGSYEQFGDAFVHSLSIIDVMMFNSRSELKQIVASYALS
jgi:hypothetical protein